MPVKLGFIILSLIGVLRIPEEFYLYKDKDKGRKKEDEKIFQSTPSTCELSTKHVTTLSGYVHSRKPGR